MTDRQLISLIRAIRWIAIFSLGSILLTLWRQPGRGLDADHRIELIVVVTLVVAALAPIPYGRRLRKRYREYRERTAQLWESEDSRLACPACHDDRIVRGVFRASWWAVDDGPILRYLTCGHRGPATKAQWRQAAQSDFADPHQMLSDKYDHVFNGRLSGTQIVTCLIGMFMGPAIAVSVAWRLGLSESSVWSAGYAVGLPVGLVGGWYLGRLLSPPRVERKWKCRQCGYDLRRLTEPRCPECGLPFDADPDLSQCASNRTREPDAIGVSSGGVTETAAQARDRV